VEVKMVRGWGSEGTVTSRGRFIPFFFILKGDLSLLLPFSQLGRRGWGMRASTISLTIFEKWY
jgi:hypothetical protein